MGKEKLWADSAGGEGMALGWGRGHSSRMRSDPHPTAFSREGWRETAMSLICSLLPGAVRDGETALAPHLLPSQERGWNVMGSP